MRVMTVVGARPEFIQTAPVSQVLRQQHLEILVHTGQHYDVRMSQVFFEDLGVPEPDYNLGVGSGSHAQQTGQIMIRLEPIIQDEQPDWVLVYGDTNTTAAAGLVAAKLSVPLAHIEAGLRSHDRTMPEEINRVITDHLSDLLFAPTQAAVDNLQAEGLVAGVHQVGDVRVDLLADLARWDVPEPAQTRQAQGLPADGVFALVTIHRAGNTDRVERLGGIVAALNDLSLPVVLPAHPRLQKMMARHGLTFSSNVQVIEPVGFLGMMALLQACAVVLTDSGGLQKEAYLLRRPVVTVRDNTEWVETVEAGWNRLCPAVPLAIQAAVAAALDTPPVAHPDYYGSPGVSGRICTVLETTHRPMARRPVLTAER